MHVIPGPRIPSYPDPTFRWRKRRLYRGLAILGALGVVLLLLPTGLRAFAGTFRVDNPQKSDAIVLLLGGMGNRPEWAAKLYREGLAPVIFMGNSGTIGNSSLSESLDTRKLLVDEGVPASSVIILPPPVVTSTRMEAEAVREYAKGHPLNRIIVITTAFHTRRARWVFRRELSGMNIDVRCAAAPHPLFNESNWYRSDEGLVTYLDEFIKTVYYWVSY